MFRRFLVWLVTLASLATLPAQDPRVQTSREQGKQLLKLPKEEDAFGFVVFGDRTGGPPEGIQVLAQAVADTNLLDPDLVMTVGDLVNGYNDTPEWMAQAKEYRDTMSKLRMPWFPVAGNHDVYWRGKGEKPKGEHEGNFEKVFGPLWYAVEHKHCWFVVLYSDEGNPATGEKNSNKPECQRISDAQFAWLGETLQKAKDAQHVFVFLHHPRWLAQYGDDWDRVHALLAKNGNVTAVFAGHIHRMRYDGVKDGIAYYTVAAVGAHLGMEAPQAGYLHQFHVVTVRPQGITVAALPVGTVIDPQQITGEISDECTRVNDLMRTELASCVAAGDGEPVTLDSAVDAVITLRFDNPAKRPIEVELTPLADPSWVFSPDHQHAVVPGGKAGTATFAVRRAGQSPGQPPAQPLALPHVQVRCDYLAADRRIGLPQKEETIELPPPKGLGDRPAQREGVLALDGKNACLQLAPARVGLPDGPFTLELWLRGDDFTGRRGIVAKTELSEFALFGSDGKLDFSVFLGERYATASSAAGALTPGAWHHVAGVFDGAELRAYLDGKLVGTTKGSGARKTNTLPLFVGADPNSSGAPTSFFAGAIDDVRLSKVARYAGASFTPPVHQVRDADTVLLLACDEDFGPWTADSSGNGAHPLRVGSVHCTVESRPGTR